MWVWILLWKILRVETFEALCIRNTLKVLMCCLMLCGRWRSWIVVSWNWWMLFNFWMFLWIRFMVWGVRAIRARSSVKSFVIMCYITSSRWDWDMCVWWCECEDFVWCKFWIWILCMKYMFMVMCLIVVCFFICLLVWKLCVLFVCGVCVIMKMRGLVFLFGMMCVSMCLLMLCDVVVFCVFVVVWVIWLCVKDVNMLMFLKVSRGKCVCVFFLWNNWNIV